jgi:rubrerythrin
MIFVSSKLGRIYKLLKQQGYEVHDLDELFTNNIKAIVIVSDENIQENENLKVIKADEFSIEKIKEFLREGKCCPICGSLMKGNVCEVCGYQKRY